MRDPSCRPFLFALLLSLVATACASDPAETSDSSDVDLSAGQTLVLGAIAPGETKNVDYTRGPTYRAFSFAGRKGQKVDFWVRGAGGDPAAYILRPNRTTFVQNDDADPTTTDAHVTATIPNDGTYFVAMNERKRRSLKLTVTFAGPTPPASYAVGVTWNGDLAREEIHQVDLATLAHTLIAPLPGIQETSDSFTDRVHGRVYVRTWGATADARMTGIDASTGAILSSAPMPSWSYDATKDMYHGFAFGNFNVMASGAVVAVAQNGDLSRPELRNVDPASMIHTLIAPIAGSASESFADPDRNTLYLVRAAGADRIPRLLTANASTGAITSNPPLPPFSYDAATGAYHGFNFGILHALRDGTVVGVTWNGELAREEIRKVDPMTMTHTLIAALPGITWTSSSYLDPFRSIIYVNAGGPDGVVRLFGIDATTGAIVSNPRMPDFTYDQATHAYHGFNFGAGFHVMR